MLDDRIDDALLSLKHPDMGKRVKIRKSPNLLARLWNSREYEGQIGLVIGIKKSEHLKIYYYQIFFSDEIAGNNEKTYSIYRKSDLEFLPKDYILPIKINLN